MNLEMWNTKAYEPVIELLKNRQIPEDYPPETMVEFFLSRGLDDGFFAVRDQIVGLSGYAMLTWAWLRPMARWIGDRRCLEVMGGSGALSKCLQELGVSIRCTDSYDWAERAPFWFSEPWTEVEKLDAVSAIKMYGKDTDIVVCSWPYMSNDCFEALEAMRSVNPACLMLYIGDGKNGATANDAFFEAAIPVKDEAFLDAASQYVTCHAMRDRPMLFR